MTLQTSFEGSEGAAPGPGRAPGRGRACRKTPRKWSRVEHTETGGQVGDMVGKVPGAQIM